jgi:sec-independent protein translocase protein TatC
MSLVDHLSELRGRLVKSVIAIVVGSVIGWLATPSLIAFLRGPLGDRPLVFLSPGEAFFVYLKISVAVGIILAMPVILYQVWAFVSPGLTPAERRVVRPWVPLALVLFAIGVLVAYVVLPFAMAFLLSFEQPQNDIRATITMNNYFGFITTLFLAFGLTMEFPVLLFGLSRVGIVTSARLRAARRYVIVGISIFATVVTPGGDIVSPTVLGLTMYALFELAIVFIRRSGR